MHVALFTDFHPTTVGGIQTSVNALRRGLERAGHQVTIFAAPTRESTEYDPDLVVLSALAGVSVNGFAAVLPTAENNKRIDAAFAVRGPVDVVHLHTTYGVAVAGLRAARRHGIPVVQTVHSRDDAFIQHTSPTPYLSALTMRALHGRFVPHGDPLPPLPESRAAHHAWRTMVGHARNADHVVVPTEHFARRFRDHGLERPITVISNGIDDDLLDAARAAVDSGVAGSPAQVANSLAAEDLTTRVTTGSDIERTSLRVVWCARLSAEKRLLEAIEAVRLAPECTLDIYGSGDQEGAAREAVTAAGIEERVRLHGAVPQGECLAAMARHDVLLFPSMGFDTQGMALLEAVAMGLPVVYCDPDMDETVPKGGGARTADPSPSAIARTLRELAADPSRLESMRYALAGHTDSTRQSTLTGAMVAVYESVAKEVSVQRLSDVPTAPGGLPLLGHSLVALRGGLDFVTSLTDLGPIVRIYLGPRPAYVLTTPELIREVGFGTAGAFHREEMREAVHDVLRGASNVLSGTPHELRRRMIAPALRQRRLAEYATVAAGLADEWARSLPADRPLNLVAEAHRLVLDVITATLFTADFGADAKSEVRQNIPWLLSHVVQRAALPPPVRRMRVVANHRFKTKAAALRREIGAVVAEYRRADRDFHDVLSALVRHTDDETGATLSDEEIVDELILMLAAGVGSTASIMAWVWHEAARDPGIGDELRRELDDFVGREPVRPEHVTSLPYLRSVVLETLRFWGPWVSTQTADGPVTLGGVTLPDGAMVVYSPYLVHHTERYYPAPETFDPDRWFPGRVEEIDKKAILPFGVGARHCPGNTFAILTVTLATAALFARWRVDPDPGHTVRANTTDFVPSPDRLPVTLRPRW
ncbi:cytochrome P450 [Nocardia puris]|uniref:cytochrome P450 n=1 Tax=Nocardia puris TaxID=208602 RepID=UPI001895F5E3|nr:cytochrome P450 [Nocardia puris]MBF6212032.1 cytochrome P450 [Nocardia puris]MBF6367058.1 cytochrome P450 [Nocardia puris]MBF6461965.1 cytochrome P450 [Nocardia puris]